MIRLDNKKNFFEIINRLINFNKVSHAYLIEVDNYDEDFKYILDFVKLILCTNADKSVDGLNCSRCKTCNFIDDGNYLDLKIIEPEGNFIKKKQLLDLQEEYNNKSLLGNKRIYIIKEVDKLNLSSANTILKFLEEPEDDIIAILVTKNRYQVLDTIISRCQILSLQSNNFNINLSENVLLLLRYIVNKEDLFIRYNEIFMNILPDKVVASDVLEQLQMVLINYLDYCSSSDKVDYNIDVLDVLKGFDVKYITSRINIIEEEMKKLEYNVNYKLWLDGLFARLIGG